MRNLGYDARRKYDLSEGVLLSQYRRDLAEAYQQEGVDMAGAAACRAYRDFIHGDPER